MRWHRCCLRKYAYAVYWLASSSSRRAASLSREPALPSSSSGFQLCDVNLLPHLQLLPQLLLLSHGRCLTKVKRT